jgi:hypothetical protein
MKIGIALMSVVVLTGILFYMVGSKWERAPKNICWAEMVVSPITDEAKGEFVLLTRKGRNHEVIRSNMLGGEFVLQKNDGSQVLSTPIFEPDEILPEDARLFTAVFKTSEGKIKKHSRTQFKCQ